MSNYMLTLIGGKGTKCTNIDSKINFK
jgi:hypothetical protein